MKQYAALLVCAVLLSGAAGAEAQTSPIVETYYSPTDNLEQVDVGLIRSARRSINMAAYTFSSFAVLDALIAAGRRGVQVRLLLDPSQLQQRHESALSRVADLAGLPGAEVRVKGDRDLMHLKSYVIDGVVLRTGSANFTPSGLKRQNNDLIVLRDGKAIGRFSEEFKKAFAIGRPYETKSYR